jgi:hypothetical protein
LWRSLGTFHLAPGDAAQAVIGNGGTDSYVTVDAIQLIPMEH